MNDRRGRGGQTVDARTYLRTYVGTHAVPYVRIARNAAAFSAGKQWKVSKRRPLTLLEETCIFVPVLVGEEETITLNAVPFYKANSTCSNQL